jgi:hypothetical protein
MNNGRYYIYAEYNPFWIYMGWWLYAAPIVEGSQIPPNGEYDRPYIKSTTWPDHDHVEWFNNDWQLDVLMKCLTLPELNDYRGLNHSSYTQAFLKEYPAGVICGVENYGREFTLISSKPEYVWEYFEIVRRWQMLKWARSSKETQDKLEVLERELRDESRQSK